MKLEVCQVIQSIKATLRYEDYDFDSDHGFESTPSVVDGVMYTTGSWSIVYAIDARTGKEIWK